MSTTGIGIGRVLEPTDAHGRSAAPSSVLVKWNNKVLVAILGMAVGTGGVANAATLARVPGRSHVIVTLHDINGDDNKESETVLLPSEKLTHVQRYFALNVTDLSNILRVARPTVYSWIRQQAVPREAHSERIEKIYELARSWRFMSAKPVGAFLTVKLAGGTSLLERLSAEHLDEAAVLSALKDIVRAQVSSKQPNITERARRRGLKPVAREVGNWSSDEIFNS